MIIYKIKYAEGTLEGYFIETQKGFLQVNIREGEANNLSKIVSKEPIRINEATLKVEIEKFSRGYIS